MNPDKIKLANVHYIESKRKCLISQGGIRHIEEGVLVEKSDYDAW